MGWVRESEGIWICVFGGLLCAICLSKREFLAVWFLSCGEMGER